MNIVRNYLVALLLWFGGFRKVPRDDQAKVTGRTARLLSKHSAGKWVGGLSGGIGIAGLGAGKLLSLLGFTAVAHSSGATILTGAGGYIAGTYGLAAGIVAIITAPFTILIFLVCFAVGVWVLLKNKRENKE